MREISKEQIVRIEGVYRVEGKPSATMRPTASRWGLTFSKSFTAWVACVQRAIAHVKPDDRPCDLSVTVYVDKPKKTERETPNGRLDGYLHGVIEGLVKAGVLRDAKQIKTLSGTKTWAHHGNPEGAAICIDWVD